MLKMKNLEKCFINAKENNATWVAIAVKARDCESSELILNTNVNFDKKLEYYKKAYTDELVLKTYDGIKIVGFTYGDSLADIEADLFPKETDCLVCNLNKKDACCDCCRDWDNEDDD